MNSQQTDTLQSAANALSRAEQRNRPKALGMAYKDVRIVVESIYEKSVDVPTVLRVEQILNDGDANVLGNSKEAYDRMKELSGKNGTQGRTAVTRLSDFPLSQ